MRKEILIPILTVIALGTALAIYREHTEPGTLQRVWDSIKAEAMKDGEINWSFLGLWAGMTALSYTVLSE